MLLVNQTTILDASFYNEDKRLYNYVSAIVIVIILHIIIIYMLS